MYYSIQGPFSDKASNSFFSCLLDIAAPTDRIYIPAFYPPIFRESLALYATQGYMTLLCTENENPGQSGEKRPFPHVAIQANMWYYALRLLYALLRRSKTTPIIGQNGGHKHSAAGLGWIGFKIRKFMSPIL
jgi:hypothetical protein